jgi:hypothetical protein
MMNADAAIDALGVDGGVTKYLVHIDDLAMRLHYLVASYS